jgi:hypothetical protein
MTKSAKNNLKERILANRGGKKRRRRKKKKKHISIISNMRKIGRGATLP